MDGAARALGRSSVDSAARTFNEGEEVVKPSGRTETRQWTIDPKDGQPRGFAFVWRRFEISDLPVPLLQRNRAVAKLRARRLSLLSIAIRRVA